MPSVTQEALRKYGGVGGEKDLWSRSNCYLCPGFFMGVSRTSAGIFLDKNQRSLEQSLTSHLGEVFITVSRNHHTSDAGTDSSYLTPLTCSLSFGP